MSKNSKVADYGVNTEAFSQAAAKAVDVSAQLTRLMLENASVNLSAASKAALELVEVQKEAAKGILSAKTAKDIFDIHVEAGNKVTHIAKSEAERTAEAARAAVDQFTNAVRA